MSAPPILPDMWSASYVSYWFPRQAGDEMTSGHVWFDYPGERFRIDGLFNPWDEAATGHRLWMSEIGWPGQGTTFKLTVPYPGGPQGHAAGDPAWRSEPLAASLLPQRVLAERNAQRVDTPLVLGEAAHAWRFERPGAKGPATYVWSADERRLLRMVTGDPQRRASIRDFFNFSAATLAPSIFELPPACRAAGSSDLEQAP
jgi:anthraniloyl-CoA monooxygenase